MKSFFFAFLIGVTACSSSNSSVVTIAIKDHNTDLSQLQEDCIKLGRCMGGKYNIIHFSNKTSGTPFACEINLGPWRSYYFYPDSSLSFNDLGRRNFKNAIVACNLLKKTGDYSDSYIETQKANIKELDKYFAQKRIKSKPSPIPTIEIKEFY